MKFAALILASISIAGAKAPAPFIAGNEAVRMSTSGRVAETPPLPASVAHVCAASEYCHAGPWYMVETADGLEECTEPYARVSSCRTSTYGSRKLPRLWIVKTGAIWRWCQYPDLASRCPDMFARPPANLPFDAIQ
jgi:hypothetical protein